MKRQELVFQNHIIDSYANCGGYAQKWASEWQAHKPDLICCLPEYGVHLLEVKHVPEFGSTKLLVKNPLTEGQKRECKKYLKAGGVVRAAVISNSSKAIGSFLGLACTQQEYWHHDKILWVPYKPAMGYNLALLRFVANGE